MVCVSVSLRCFALQLFNHVAWWTQFYFSQGDGLAFFPFELQGHAPFFTFAVIQFP